jgi:hypothetical protein
MVAITQQRLIEAGYSRRSGFQVVKQPSAIAAL